MANFKRGKCRYQGRITRTDKTWFLNACPRWWDILHRHKPRRRLERSLAKGIVAGRIDADIAAWPLSSNKPHHYYW